MQPTVDWIGPTGEKLAGPAGAVGAEVQEYDAQGVPAGRTYADVSAVPRVTLAQTQEEEDIADPDSADYLKDTWDLWDPVSGEPVATREELCRVLGAGEDTASQRVALAGMLELPSWQAAPETLKTEVRAWLAATRPKTAGT